MSCGQTVFKCQFNNAKTENSREYSSGWRVSAVWCRLQSSATIAGFVSSPWSPAGASYSAVSPGLATWWCTAGSNISRAFLVLVVSTSCHFVLVYLHFIQHSHSLKYHLFYIFNTWYVSMHNFSLWFSMVNLWNKINKYLVKNSAH